ncbi:MAG TPA: mechanosensitive ion channel family protein [Planctomycetota bacterium]|nr:mechanosensitive ion channel family protein [Planctomycetota bacterium]
MPLVVLIGTEHAESAHHEVRLISLVAAAIAGASLATLNIFDILLPLVRTHPPAIVRDLTAAAIAIASCLIVAHRLDFNLSGIIATSAVMTAVIGFSLQDTLGNIMGGLAVQLDNSVRVGDWVSVASIQGKVSEIRWRYTAIETRNWETLVVPNSMLMKGQVTVLGRRRGQPVQLRRYIWFNVDYRFAPNSVIGLVDAAVQTPIDRVAQEPKAHTVLMEMEKSYGRYAVRYWLTDIAIDDRTDTLVRSRIFFALKRAGIPFAIPAEANFVETDSEHRRADKAERDLQRRLGALSHVTIFHGLGEEDRLELAEGLHDAPFARGEALTKQGAEAHWLYIVDKGEVSVRVGLNGAKEREVARVKDGSFFGEMSLMTGAPRSATVVALTDVQCYRLEKDVFQRVIERRPELAAEIAKLLAERKVALDSVKEDLTEEAKKKRLAAHEADLLGSIRSFFGLGASAGKG